jgi:hypothetical protein
LSSDAGSGVALNNGNKQSIDGFMANVALC